MSKVTSKIEKNVKAVSNVKEKPKKVLPVKKPVKKPPSHHSETTTTSSSSSTTSSSDDDSSDSSYDSSEEEEPKKEGDSPVNDEDSDADMELLTDALQKTSMKRQNKTFSDHKVREIERGNSVLMKKLISNNNRQTQYATGPAATKVSSSAINRKKKQTQIDHDNLLLLRKLQSVKPFTQHKKI